MYTQKRSRINGWNRSIFLHCLWKSFLLVPSPNGVVRYLSLNQTFTNQQCPCKVWMRCNIKELQKIKMQKTNLLYFPLALTKTTFWPAALVWLGELMDMKAFRKLYCSSLCWVSCPLYSSEWPRWQHGHSFCNHSHSVIAPLIFGRVLRNLSDCPQHTFYHPLEGRVPLVFSPLVFIPGLSLCPLAAAGAYLLWLSDFSFKVMTPLQRDKMKQLRNKAWCGL